MNEIHREIFGLLVACPFSDNPTDCPLASIRKKSLEERLAWLQKQSDEECQLFLEEHLKCLHCKEAG